ncbi:hypothetical protein ACFX19_001630 [Malus domestica]
MRLPQLLLSDNFTSPIKPRLGNIVGVIKPSGSRADSGTNLVLLLFRFRSNGKTKNWQTQVSNFCQIFIDLSGPQPTVKNTKDFSM